MGPFCVLPNVYYAGCECSVVLTFLWLMCPLPLPPPSQPVVIRTAQLVKAIHLASLIDAYCIVYTANSHSRITGVGKRVP